MKTECTKRSPNKKAEAHNNVIDIWKITVTGGKAVRSPMLKCLDCGLEVSSRGRVDKAPAS